MQQTFFVDVLLPLPLQKSYTYRVPFELNPAIQAGQRVMVQFGKQKLYSGLIRRVHETPPAEYEAKYILGVLDEHPVVFESQFEYWEWMASYYLCTTGEVMNAALPAAMKLQSETKIVLNPDFAQNYDLLNDKEYLIAEALEINSTLTMEEVSKIVSQKSVFPLIKGLIDKGVVLVEEELLQRYKPKILDFVRLTEKATDESWLKEIFEQLEKKAPKQLELLLSFYSLHQRDTSKEIRKSDLLKDADGSLSQLNGLVKKGVLEIYQQEVSRLQDGNLSEKELTELNEEQQSALVSIKEQFREKDVVLLHGITSSGKTEIYVHLIHEALQQGKQVLYLLPEIALTSQIINRLRKYFGNKVGIYHSKFNDQERVEVWKNVALGITRVVLGARSASFLPFSDLGLVIVDEEHENSFKQYDPAPRYHARDAAIYLAWKNNAKTLLGSATPSIESYYNAQQGKYGFAAITKRYGNIQLPEIVVADVKEERKKKLLKSHFTTVLLDHIGIALEQKEQVILFQNRRGFAPFLECADCSWVPHCKNCDVSLTYHKYSSLLHCHYCGSQQIVPRNCGACGGTNVQMQGFGTEKIEEELAVFFPEARIARMDLDSTRAKNAYGQIISDFEEGKIDILVGTQMVSKGLDFDNVSTVGILNADNLINYPDFRAYERSFQMIAQVSGRAGRKGKRGKVVIQTTNPNYTVIQNVISNDYEAMYNYEILERKNFKYPPFYRLIEFTIKHKEQTIAGASAVFFAQLLKQHFGERVLGPESPLISRIKNYYLKSILLKIEKELSVKSAKDIIRQCIEETKLQSDFRSVIIQADVDPV